MSPFGRTAQRVKVALAERALRLIESPACVGALQRSPLLDIVTGGLSIPARARVAMRQTGSSVARALGLATVEDLRRVERELERRLDDSCRPEAG